MSKKTIILGASDNEERYSYKAAIALQNHAHPIVLFGKHSGNVNGIEIIKDKPFVENVDTVTVYLNPQNQKDWYESILKMNPKRVIFNPGAENEELKILLEKNNIEVLEACTLVMLSIGNY